MCRETGMLHFFVNGIDQGAAASNIPDRVYGVIDLYGQAAQATIVDTLDCYSPDTVNSSLSNTTIYRLSCSCLAHVVICMTCICKFSGFNLGSASMHPECDYSQF
jgi:hypothetical protein